MAKLECSIKGNFHSFLSALDNAVLNGSVSASYEDGSSFQCNGVFCAVRVYERYSYFGKNRVSLNITLFGTEEDFVLSAVTAGGSQAVFFKINTVGEENFLDCVRDFVEQYQREHS